jgi:hypothetical protein
LTSPSPFDSTSLFDHLADATESLSQVVSDQDALVDQARREFDRLHVVIEDQAAEILGLCELLSCSTQDFEEKLLESSVSSVCLS